MKLKILAGLFLGALATSPVIYAQSEFDREALKPRVEADVAKWDQD